MIDKEVYDDVIDNYFVLKENGNALVNFGEEKLVNWEKTDTSISNIKLPLFLTNIQISLMVSDNSSFFLSTLIIYPIIL